MKRKCIVIIVICFVLIILNIGFGIFTHSTVERAIRADLFFRGYFVKAFKTEISKRPIPDSQYGTMYICRNPSIGPDSYHLEKKYKYFWEFEYWYVDINGTGGG